MFRATKVRIFPTKAQQELLDNQFGCTRYIWNRMLRLKSYAYKKFGVKLTAHQLIVRIAKLKERHPWLKDADSQALQQSIRNLDRAFKNFFEKRTRYPKFKKKYGKQSAQYPQRVKLDEQQTRIFLPKIGWVNGKFYRKIIGTIKTVTLSRSKTGKYYAAILCDIPYAVSPQAHINAELVVGIDVGLLQYASLSDGEQIDNPRFLKKHTRNLRRKQKQLSRKVKGSKNRKKARLIVAKCHEKVANARNDFQHQLSRTIVDKNHAIIVEDLAVKNMLKNHKLAKAISDAAWGAFFSKLQYKVEEQGGRFVKIDRYFASSKTCHVCGTVAQEMPLSIRSWRCEGCFTLHDRDINAALNIKAQGINILQAEGCSVSACGSLCKTIHEIAVA